MEVSVKYIEWYFDTNIAIRGTNAVVLFGTQNV